MKVTDSLNLNSSVVEPEDEVLETLRRAAIEHKQLLAVEAGGRCYLAPPRLLLPEAQRASFHQALSALQNEIGHAQFDQDKMVAFVSSNEYNANASIKSLFSAECSSLAEGKIRVAILVGSSNLPSMLPELLKHADIVLFCDRNPLMLEHNHFNIRVLRSCRVGSDYLDKYFDPKENPWLINKVQTGRLAEYSPGTEELITTTESREIDGPTLLQLTISYLDSSFKTTSEEDDDVNCAFLPDENRFQYCVSAAKMLSFQSLNIDLFDQNQVNKLKAKLDELGAVVTVFNVSSLYYYDAPNNFSPMPQADKPIWRCTGNLLRSLQALTNDETYILFSQYTKAGSQVLYSQFTRGWKNYMSSMLTNVKQLNSGLVPVEILAAARNKLAQQLNEEKALPQQPISALKSSESEIKK